MGLARGGGSGVARREAARGRPPDVRATSSWGRRPCGRRRARVVPSRASATSPELGARVERALDGRAGSTRPPPRRARAALHPPHRATVAAASDEPPSPSWPSLGHAWRHRALRLAMVLADVDSLSLSFKSKEGSFLRPSPDGRAAVVVVAATLTLAQPARERCVGRRGRERQCSHPPR